MGSTTIQARFGERQYSIGRLVLDRARALGMSRSELVRHLGYRHVGNGHRALSELLTTRQNCTVDRTASRRGSPSGERTRPAVTAATARQQQDEASQRTLARETAYRTAFKPHLRCETERAIPEPLFVAALLTSARLRLVPVCSETWHASADERDRLLKRAIQDHYREHAARIIAFGAVVAYTAVLMPGYLVDFGFSYDLNGDPVGPMQSVERLQEAFLVSES